MIADQTAKRMRADLIPAVEEAGVPVGPINTVAEAFAEPQVMARGLKITAEGIAGLRTPLNFSRSTLTLERAAAALGAGSCAFRQPFHLCSGKMNRWQDFGGVVVGDLGVRRSSVNG